jgi:hypothetical protein
VDRGVALTAQLLQSKYVELHAPVIAPDNVLPHMARTSSGRDDKPIEFLGELQIRQRQQLHEFHKISLRRQGIAGLAVMTKKQGNQQQKDDEDDSLFENIRDVDLAGNLLSSWKDALTIMEQFPKLTDFSVAYK